MAYAAASVGGWLRCTQTVSYTHLDVYKRQAVGAAGGVVHLFGQRRVLRVGLVGFAQKILSSTKSEALKRKNPAEAGFFQRDARAELTSLHFVGLQALLALHNLEGDLLALSLIHI